MFRHLPLRLNAGNSVFYTSNMLPQNKKSPPVG